MLFSTDTLIPYLQERIQKEVYSRNPAVNKILSQPLQGKGKMLRPQLVLSCSRLFGEVNEEALVAAMAVECIHTASLVHDDIIDQASMRRGVPCTHHLYGAKAAVLVGDHYFATAFELLTRYHQTAILEEVTRAIKEMCEGEISQDIKLFDPAITEADYYRNIYGKTAVLFAAACRSGALAAKAQPEEVEMMGQFGESLGYAYQMADDIADFTADEDLLGKPVGSDLRNGIITLPVIRALVVSEERLWLAELIKSCCIDESSMSRTMELIIGAGAIGYVLTRIRERIMAAQTALAHFKDNSARRELMDLCAVVLDFAGLNRVNSDQPNHEDMEYSGCSEYQPGPGL